MERKEVPSESVLRQIMSFISDCYKSDSPKQEIRSHLRTLCVSSSGWALKQLGIEDYSPNSPQVNYARLRLEHFQRMRTLAEDGISKWADELADALAEHERETNEQYREAPGADNDCAR